MTKLLMISFAILGLLAVHVASQSEPDYFRDSLAGVKSMRVFVGGLEAEAARYGLYSEILKSQIELRLRQNGITVYEDASECLSVMILSYFSEQEGIEATFFYTIQVRFSQAVKLFRNDEFCPNVVTWSSFIAVGISPATKYKEVVNQAVIERMDEFINDYLAVNPKK